MFLDFGGYCCIVYNLSKAGSSRFSLHEKTIVKYLHKIVQTSTGKNQKIAPAICENIQKIGESQTEQHLSNPAVMRWSVM
jgi:hypothetical protein